MLPSQVRYLIFANLLRRFGLRHVPRLCQRVNDRDTQHAIRIAPFTALFGLTPSEARLLEALLAGERVAHYAERAGISVNTANTQIRQIFTKTDTTRQADLVRKVQPGYHGERR